jgi:hypothetical protein
MKDAEARVAVDRATKQARMDGGIFPLGVLTEVANFPRLHETLEADAAARAAIVKWLADSLEPGLLRMAVFAGPHIQLQAVHIGSIVRDVEPW